MSRTATAEIWNELRAAEAEIERLRSAYDKLCKGTPAFRASIIEECARVVEQWENDDTPRSYLDLIAAIRALKDKP